MSACEWVWIEISGLLFVGESWHGWVSFWESVTNDEVVEVLVDVIVVVVVTGGNWQYTDKSGTALFAATCWILIMGHTILQPITENMFF
jgi:hypothetical protein